MQGSFVRLDTAFASIVEKSMEKRDEIPPSKKGRSFTNAAPKKAVEAVQEKVEALDWDWHKAEAAAGVSRNVGYALLRGEGSIGSLRKVEEWLAKEQAHRSSQVRPPQEEWAVLGQELEQLGPGELERITEALAEYVRAAKRKERLLRKLANGGRDYND